MSEHIDEALEELRELLRDLRMSQTDQCYGFFRGGDPNNFTPDPECSTEEERARHKEACEKWPDVVHPAPHCQLGFTREAPPGFGLGVNTVEDETVADWADRLDRCLERLTR